MSNLCLSLDQSKAIENLLCEVLRNKFQNYAPETSVMPFHTRLLGNDRMALFSFIHSINTNFGTTIFEPVAKQLAYNRFKESCNQASPEKIISSDALIEIQNIMDDLRAATATPNKAEEIERIRKVCRSGKPHSVKLTKIDLMLKSHDEELFFFDIKTAKPNKGGFQEFKRTLLEWVAATLYVNPDQKITTAIAIPYNPYSPKPYSRWTMAGMLDLTHELKVAEEFWDFLGGDGAYQDILQCFENVGILMRSDIDDYFSTFNKQRR